VPTYQYACTACDERLEAVQSFSDAALTECPACHGTLRKVFSAVGVVFKGSGFYKNDSRDAPKKAAAKTDGKTDGKTDTPAATPAAASSSSGDSKNSTPSTPAKAAPAPASKTA